MDEFKIDIKEIRFRMLDWIHQILDRRKLRAVFSKVMDVRFKQKVNHILA